MSVFYGYSCDGLVSLTCLCRSKSIQRLVKVLEKSPLIYTLTLALSSVLGQLMTNRTGSFVILKCLNLLDTQKNEVLFMFLLLIHIIAFDIVLF